MMKMIFLQCVQMGISYITVTAVRKNVSVPNFSLKIHMNGIMISLIQDALF